MSCDNLSMMSLFITLNRPGIVFGETGMFGPSVDGACAGIRFSDLMKTRRVNVFVSANVHHSAVLDLATKCDIRNMYIQGQIFRSGQISKTRPYVL